MASITELWRDDFDNAVVDLDTDPGNGTIAEAGSELSLSCGSGVDCNGWDGGLAPYATKKIEDVIAIPTDGLLIAEARVTDFVISGVESIQYLVWDFARNYGYWLGWYPSNSSLYVQGRRGGSGETFWNGGTYSGPGTTPHRYRIVWNPTAKPLRIPEVISQYPLDPGSVAFLASVDDGASWNYVHSREMSDINPPAPNPSDMRIGMMCRNWGAFPSMDQQTDYIRLLRTTGDQSLTVPVEPTGAPVDEVDASHDEAEIKGTEGATSHLLSAWDGDAGGGLWVPHAEAQVPPGAIRRLDEVDFTSDEPTPWVGGVDGGFPRHLWPDKAPTSDTRLGGVREVFKKSAGPYPIDGRTYFEGLTLGSLETNGVRTEPRARDEVGFADELVRFLGLEPTYNTTTLDLYGRPHFNANDARVINTFLYDTSNDGVWRTPTDPGFTGYGKDGKYYVNGVDQGTQAPWANEVASNDRGGRSDFPDRALIVVGGNELVIFDLDTYPTTLNLWMRFRMGDSSNYYMLGRGSFTLNSAAMVDGVLVVVGQQTPWEVGRIMLVDFKATGQNCAHLIGSDNHWFWTAGFDITHRNEAHYTSSGPSPSLRIVSEYNKHVDVHFDNADPSNLWIVTSGEDAGDPSVVQVVDGVPSRVVSCNGEDYGGSSRPCVFDAQGMLWFAIDDRLWLNGLAYRDGVIHTSVSLGRFRNVRFPEAITHIADDGNLLWIGTARGVFRFDKGSFDYYLAYTIDGGGGLGKDRQSRAGELIPGSRYEIAGMSVTRLAESSYLGVATVAPGGGAALIRLYDDIVIDSREFPVLAEDGAYMHDAIFG